MAKEDEVSSNEGRGYPAVVTCRHHRSPFNDSIVNIWTLKLALDDWLAGPQDVA